MTIPGGGVELGVAVALAGPAIAGAGARAGGAAAQDVTATPAKPPVALGDVRRLQNHAVLLVADCGQWKLGRGVIQPGGEKVSLRRGQS